MPILARVPRKIRITGMRSPDERHKLQAHFQKLGQGKVISWDADYWTVYWTWPQGACDVFELLLPSEIQAIRDRNLTNFVLLLRKLCSRIVKATSPAEALNAVRFLTRLVPFLYELPTYSDIEDLVFWKHYDPLRFALKQEEDKPHHLGKDLLIKLVDLLFTPGFTVDPSPRNTLVVWEPGIGSTSRYQAPNHVFDSNRTEILRLLLVLILSLFYIQPLRIIAQGSRFLSALVSSVPKTELLTLVCSLINLVCRSSRLPDDNGLVYANAALTKSRHLTVTYAIELLAIMVVYPMPAHQNVAFLEKPYNIARLYVGKLHRENELMFLASHFLNILQTPMVKAKEGESSKFNLSLRSAQPSLWATEALVILWELFQCNKAFRAAVRDRYIHEIVTVLLYHIQAFHESPPHANSVRLASYFILYVSADETLMKPLLRPIPPVYYESLPVSFKPNPRPITTRDFLVIQLCTLLTAPRRPSNVLSATLVEIFYNCVPLVDPEINDPDIPQRKLSNANPGGGLSYSACSAITNLITKLSTRAFLLEAPFHSEMIALVFRSVCMALTKNPQASRMLLFSILKNEKIYDLVWNTIFSLDPPPNPTKLPVIQDIIELEDTLSEDSLSRVNSHTSQQISISGSLEVEELSEAEFIQSLNPPSPVLEASEHTPPSVDFTGHDDANDNIDAALRPKPPTGMSTKVKEKLPKNSPLRRSWGGTDALRIILTVIIPHLKLSLKDMWTARAGSSVDSFLLIKHIEATDFEAMIEAYRNQINHDFLPTTPWEPLKFTWSHLSLGWYISILHGKVYNSSDNVTAATTGGAANIMRNLSSSFASFASGWLSSPEVVDPDTLAYVTSSLTSTNVWANTAIKLFKVEYQITSFFPIDTKNTPAPGTPGGVNDMANSLVRRFSDFRLNNTSRASISSVNSVVNTPIEEQEPLWRKNSVNSLHSLNAINRSRSITPRSSFSTNE